MRISYLYIVCLIVGGSNKGGWRFSKIYIKRKGHNKMNYRENRK